MSESKLFCKGDAAAGLGVAVLKLESLIKMYGVKMVNVGKRVYLAPGEFDRLREILDDLKNKTEAGLDLDLNIGKVRFLIIRYDVPTVRVGTREYLDSKGRAALKAALDDFTSKRPGSLVAVA